MTDTVEVKQQHTIARFVRQDGEIVEGCVCQVWPDEVTIEEGEISHLADKDPETCPHTVKR